MYGELFSWDANFLVVSLKVISSPNIHVIGTSP